MHKRSRLTLFVSICLILVLVLTLTLACKATPTPAPKPTTPTASPSPTTPKPTTTTPAPTTTAAPVPTTTATPTPTKTYTWKALKGFVTGSNDNLGFLEFIKRVNEKAKGQLVIQDIGALEVYPADQQFEPLKLGTIDILLTSSGYIADAFPEATVLLYGFGANQAQFRSTGVMAKLDEWSRKTNGVTFIGAPFYAKFGLWLTKPVKTLADLKSVKVRSHAAYNLLLRPLGVPTVSVAIPELYTALNTGVIDGAILGNYNLTIYGIEKIIKYRIDPPFWIAMHEPVFINLKSWDALPPNLQKIITDTMIEVENDINKIYEPVNTSENAKLKAAGITPIRLSDADWLQTQKIVWEQGLPEALKKVSPDNYQSIIKLITPFYPPKQPYATVD